MRQQKTSRLQLLLSRSEQRGSTEGQRFVKLDSRRESCLRNAGHSTETLKRNLLRKATVGMQAAGTQHDAGWRMVWSRPCSVFASSAEDSVSDYTANWRAKAKVQMTKDQHAIIDSRQKPKKRKSEIEISRMQMLGGCRRHVARPTVVTD